MTFQHAVRVVAIIPHFYAQRIPSLWAAVAALQAQTLPPAAILVWDNGAELEDVPAEVCVLGRPSVYLLKSGQNRGPGARFMAASATHGATHIFFQDNDVLMHPTALQELHFWSSRMPGSVVSLEGRRKVDRPYKTWPKEYGHGLTGADPVRVDVVLGRADLVPADTLRKILPEIPNPCPEMDDLTFSAACSRLGILCWVVPGPKVKDVQMGVGMCHEPDFYTRRDAAIRELVWEVPPCPR